MPSGPRSYGSRGGSSRSGGFRSSGTSSFGRSHSVHRPRRPFRFHFGPRVYVVADRAVSIISLLVFAILTVAIFAFTNFTEMKDHKAYLKTMEADEAYYTRLVNTGTRVDADIDYEYQAFYYNGYWYYQIDYSYKDSDGKLKTGKTYANYTLSQIDYMGGEIEIAYDTSGVSIPTSYILEDIEYQYYTSEYKSARNTFIVLVLIVVLCIGVGVFVFIKNLKRVEEEKVKAEEKERAEQDALKPKYCAYCGAKINKEAIKCDNCGAMID